MSVMGNFVKDLTHPVIKIHFSNIARKFQVNSKIKFAAKCCHSFKLKYNVTCFKRESFPQNYMVNTLINFDR